MSYNLLQLIKKTALEAVENTKPTSVFFGTVESKSPIEVRVHQKLLLTEEDFVATEKLSELEEGDKLAILRLQGGQNFIVLDVIL
jgi:hypothetical protein